MEKGEKAGEDDVEMKSEIIMKTEAKFLSAKSMETWFSKRNTNSKNFFKDQYKMEKHCLESSSPFVCGICGHKGHLAKSCPVIQTLNANAKKTGFGASFGELLCHL